MPMSGRTEQRASHTRAGHGLGVWKGEVLVERKGEIHIREDGVVVHPQQPLTVCTRDQRAGYGECNATRSGAHQPCALQQVGSQVFEPLK